MEISLVSSLLKTIMVECGLKQKDLADVLEVSLDRVKSLTSGKAKKLTPEETRRLVQALNLSAHWLATGEGEMFNPEGGAALTELLVQLKLSSQRVSEMGFLGPEGLAVRDIAYGVAVGRVEIVNSGLKTLRPSPLSADEDELLGLYRKASKEIRRAAMGALAAAHSPRFEDAKKAVKGKPAK